MVEIGLGATSGAILRWQPRRKSANLCAMAKLIGNAVLLIAAAFMAAGAVIAVGIIFLYAVAVVLLRKVKPSRRPALTAGA